MPLTPVEGRAAVRLARQAIESHVGGRHPTRGTKLPPVFLEKRGVFVTINALEGGSRTLRGCIGYPEPIKPLAEAIEDVAIYASEDPRFPSPVGPEELGGLVVEVSVLTRPSDLTSPRRDDIPSKIRLGTDGLIISKGFDSGLFLPQVATEQGWDQETFISEACLKAGLPPRAWLDYGTRIQVFQAEIFGEVTPGGDIERMDPVPG